MCIRDRISRDQDVIIHLAGIASLLECQVDPYRAVDTNVAGTANVLECARKNNVRQVIFASTSAIYENCRQVPFIESHIEEEPNLVYAMTKRQSELLCQGFCDVYEMNIVVLRFFNVYGPHQDFRRQHPPLMGYITKCLLEKTVPTFYSDGYQKRDYVYIKDLMRMVAIILGRDDIPGEVFNVCTENPISVREIYDLYQTSFKTYIEPHFQEAAKFWDCYPILFEARHSLNRDRLIEEVNKFSLGSYQKAKTLLGWEPQVTYEEGINHCREFATCLNTTL